MNDIEFLLFTNQRHQAMKEKYQEIDRSCEEQLKYLNKFVSKTAASLNKSQKQKQNKFLLHSGISFAQPIVSSSPVRLSDFIINSSNEEEDFLEEETLDEKENIEEEDKLESPDLPTLEEQNIAEEISEFSFDSMDVDFDPNDERDELPEVSLNNHHQGNIDTPSKKV